MTYADQSSRSGKTSLERKLKSIEIGWVDAVDTLEELGKRTNLTVN